VEVVLGLNSKGCYSAAEYEASMKGRGRQDRRARWSLATLTAVAGGLLAVLIGAAFAAVLLSVDEMRSSMLAAQDDQAAISQARLVDNLVLDIETGQRGFVITRQDQFLYPWTAAQGHFPGQAQQLVRMSTTPAQRNLAQQISRAGESFIHYSIPVVDAARRGDPGASSLAVMLDGKRHVDAIRGLFDSYTGTQQSAIVASEAASDTSARQSVIAASVGIAVSVLLIAGYAGYVTRVIVSPVRRAASLATRLAGGDLTARMPRTGTREIGQLETAFNTMAGSLEASLGHEQEVQRRLRLLYDTGMAVGTALDATQTARELAQVAVPRFADYATVDLGLFVLQGGEPTTSPDSLLRRAATVGVRDGAPLDPVGALVAALPAAWRAESSEAGTIIVDLSVCGADQSPASGETGRLLLDFGMKSLIAIPLAVQGVVMGRVDFWRAHDSQAFGKEDLADAEDLAAKAAVCIDNARRYTRERMIALTLQRSLLPRRLPEQSAVQTAYRYLPTGTQAGVGGDWLDVIPLSGTRVALVVGDVVGHGVHASASMGQLRSAVRTLADVDLAPDELLTHLDDLVLHLTEGDDALAGELSATCLYAIYDPISRRCCLASAGHPLPFIVDPSGAVAAVAGHPGPPLGVGGLPFETAELELPAGSTLALYTDGLVHSRELDIGQGLELLRQALARLPDSLDAACDVVMDSLLIGPAADDVALLLVRTRALSSEHVATWEISSGPEHVARARALATEQLEVWHMDESSFVTELVVSELVTNAIRYGGPPIQLRLIRDSALICEVSDGSNTAPHLRRARVFDEGGRGLLLVAQLTERWGTRYGDYGKTIWCEQVLPTAEHRL